MKQNYPLPTKAFTSHILLGIFLGARDSVLHHKAENEWHCVLCLKNRIVVDLFFVSEYQQSAVSKEDLSEVFTLQTLIVFCPHLFCPEHCRFCLILPILS